MAERRDKTPEQALSALMRLCSRAEKSSGDAMRLMARWGIPETDRPRVLGKLTESGFIDDSRYAAAYVRDRMSFSGWGPYKIVQGLRAKGVPQDIIDEAMSAADTAADRLGRMLEKKKEKLKYKDLHDLRTKLVRYGASLGYPYGEVFELVGKLTGDDD